MSKINQDIQAIDRLLTSVSWADECTVLESPDGRHRLFTGCTVMVPCHWSRFRDYVDESIRLAREHDARPALILHGETDQENVVAISAELIKNGFVPWWLNARSKVHYYDFVLSTGVDVMDYFRGKSD